MSKILKLTLILFLICAIVAGVLGVINELTYRRIEQIQAEKTARAYASVLASDGYEDLGVEPYMLNKVTVNSIAKASNGTGYVVEVSFSGAQGGITMVVGVDNDDRCTGISITEHSETSGLGANAASTAEVGVSFRDQFVGADENVKLRKSGGEIDALSGATITSHSVTNATAAAVLAVKALG